MDAARFFREADEAREQREAAGDDAARRRRIRREVERIARDLIADGRADEVIEARRDHAG